MSATSRTASSSAICGTARLHRVAARHAVLACFNMLIPYIMPEVPAAQRAALAKNVKAPLVYTNVLVRNWHPWVKLGVHEITAPMSIYSRVKLDYPVSLGGYRHPRDPAEPMCLHMVYVPVEPGHDARTQFIFGRAKLLAMEFADFEREIRDQLDRMLGAGGFSSARDIAAITVNRWSHGYAYTPSPLYDRDFGPTMEAARQPIGRVAIANSDAGWDAYAHVAIDQAAPRGARAGGMSCGSASESSGSARTRSCLSPLVGRRARRGDLRQLD